MKARITASSLAQFQPTHSPYEVFDTELGGFVMRVQPSGYRCYYLRYRDVAGNRRRIKIGKVNDIKPAEARNRAKAFLGQVASGIDVQAHKVNRSLDEQRKRRQILEVFIDEEYGPWMHDHRKRGLETVRRIKKQFAFMLKKPMSQIHPLDIERWRRERLASGISRNTVNRDLMVIKGCLSKAAEWQIIEINPLASVKGYKLERISRYRYLNNDEERRLRLALDQREEAIRQGRDRHNEHLSQRGYALFPNLRESFFADFLKPMVLLSMNTGMRRGEIMQLQWADVCLDRNQILIRAENAKNSESRYVPLNIEATTVLRQWKSQGSATPWVFPNKDGKPMTDIKKSWHGVLAAAGIEDFRWHDLRHHFASKLVMAGAELNTIRELLGHKDMTMTLRYAHLSPDKKHDAVALLNQGINMGGSNVRAVDFKGSHQ